MGFLYIPSFFNSFAYLGCIRYSYHWCSLYTHASLAYIFIAWAICFTLSFSVFACFAFLKLTYVSLRYFHICHSHCPLIQKSFVLSSFLRNPSVAFVDVTSPNLFAVYSRFMVNWIVLSVSHAGM